MYLTASNLVHYLLARGHLSADLTADGDLMIEEAVGRHRCFCVRRGGCRGLFVKQARALESPWTEALRREAACYRVLQAPRGSALAELMPRFVDYDAVHHTLTFELLSDAENLTEHHDRRQTFSHPIGGALGVLLGKLHTAGANGTPRDENRTAFPRQRPMVLRCVIGERPPIPISAANSELLRLIAEHRSFSQSLRDLHAAWKCECPIHGDVKWDNLVVVGKDDNAFDVRLVDWELADVGDAAWDVGSLLQCYLWFWLRSSPHCHGGVLQTAYAFSDESWCLFRPLLQEFWRTYVSTRMLDGQAAGQLLTQSMRYAAVRLVQSALEATAESPHIGREASIMLQAGFDLLHDPDRASSQLFGLS